MYSNGEGKVVPLLK